MIFVMVALFMLFFSSVVRLHSDNSCDVCQLCTRSSVSLAHSLAARILSTSAPTVGSASVLSGNYSERQNIPHNHIPASPLWHISLPVRTTLLGPAAASHALSTL